MLSPKAIIPLAGILLCATPCVPSFAEPPTTVEASAKPADQSKADEPPPGGCLPIGVTASGEVVFPFLCKGFLERSRTASAPQPKRASEQPASVGLAPSPEGKLATAKPEDSAPETGRSTPDPKAASAPQPIEQPKPVAEQPASSAPSPGAEGKMATAKSEDSAAESGQSTSNQVDTVSSIPPLNPPSKPLSAKERRKLRLGSAADCTHYRTFDPSTKSYRDFSGQRHPCRP